jgi:HEAT repeat protein
MMKGRILLVTLVLVALGLAFWLAPSREPSYQGRRLSAWLYDLGMESGDPNAIAAIRTIGTNAVPYLVRALSYKPSIVRYESFKVANLVFYEALHLRKTPFVDPAWRWCEGASHGFLTLGEAASNAVAPLGKLLGEPEVGWRASSALAAIGVPSVPVLTAALTNGSATARMSALWGLSFIGTNGRPAQPIVLSCLSDTNTVDGLSIRTIALTALSAMCLEPRTVVPVFTNFVDDPDFQVRVAAILYIGRFASEARFAAPSVERALADPDPRVSQAAAKALRAIDPWGAVRRGISFETNRSKPTAF